MIVLSVVVVACTPQAVLAAVAESEALTADRVHSVEADNCPVLALSRRSYHYYHHQTPSEGTSHYTSSPFLKESSPEVQLK